MGEIDVTQPGLLGAYNRVNKIDYLSLERRLVEQRKMLLKLFDRFDELREEIISAGKDCRETLDLIKEYHEMGSSTLPTHD